MLISYQKYGLPIVAEVCAAVAVALLVLKTALTPYVPSYLLGFSFVILGFGLLMGNKKGLKSDKTIVVYLLFLLSSMVSLILAASNGLNPRMLLLGWLLLLPLFVAYLLGMSLKLDFVLKSVAYISILPAILGVYQWIVRTPTPAIWVSSFETTIKTRAFGTFDNPNVFAMFLAISLVSTVVLFLKSKNKLWIALICLQSAAILASYSRSSLFAALAGIAIMVFAYRPKWLMYSPLGLLVLVVPTVRNRIMAAFSPSYINDAALDGRTWSVINGFRIFVQQPLFGTGPGSYGGKIAINYASPVYLMSPQLGYVALYYTDNQYIQILVQTGIVGMVLFLAFFALYLWGAFKYSDRFAKLAGLGVCVVFLICALFANVLEFGAIAVPAGLIMGSALGES
jgi:O-antigen ligase